jgi:hypothetical protein
MKLSLVVPIAAGLLAVPFLATATTGQHVSSVSPESKAAETRPLDLTYDQLKDELSRDRMWGSERDDRNHVSMRRLAASLQGVTDTQLETLLDQRPTSATDTTYLDLCLTEIVRRGGPHLEQVLQNRYDASLAPDKGQDSLAEKSDLELLLLTALRRLQGKDDPLRILIAGSAKVRCDIALPPTVTANVTNLDSGKRSLLLRRRPGVGARFRIDLIDPDGKAVPQIYDLDTSGLGSFVRIGYGESMSVDLGLDSYVRIDRPGTYHMTVLFHPVDEIAFGSGVDGLLCSKSIPMTLEVAPILIRSGHEEQSRVAELIRKLPKEGKIRILSGRFNPVMGDFVPNASAAGQLKQLERRAIPELLKAANDEYLNPVQRAWVLGLLYGITDHYSPLQEAGILGSYEYRNDRWYTHPNDQPFHDMGYTAMSDDPNIDQTAQKRFAKVWQEWIDHRCVQNISPDSR